MRQRSRTFFIAIVVLGAVIVAVTGAAFGLSPAAGAGSAASNADLPEIIGGPGTALGRFYRPRGITCDPAGGIYCVDQLGRIQVFDMAGKALREWSMPDTSVGKPEGLAIDLDGNLLVADTHYSRVIRFTPQGAKIQEWGNYGLSPGQFTYPLAVCVDHASGRIYVSEYGQDNDRVQYFSRDGQPLGAWGGFGVEPGKFRRPSGLAIGPDRNMYVADAVNHRVQVFTLDGAFLREWGHFGKEPGELAFPYDITVAPTGEVVVCEFGNNRVQAFSSTGESLGIVGESGDRPGQLGTPWCLTIEDFAGGVGAPDWRIIVSDTVNHRLSRWRLGQIVKGTPANPAPAAVPAVRTGVAGNGSKS